MPTQGRSPATMHPLGPSGTRSKPLQLWSNRLVSIPPRDVAAEAERNPAPLLAVTMSALLREWRGGRERFA